MAGDSEKYVTNRGMKPPTGLVSGVCCFLSCGAYLMNQKETTEE
jgi:hypothetical protein